MLTPDACNAATSVLTISAKLLITVTFLGEEMNDKLGVVNPITPIFSLALNKMVLLAILPDSNKACSAGSPEKSRFELRNLGKARVGVNPLIILAK